MTGHASVAPRAVGLLAAAGTILRQFPVAGNPVTLRDTLSFVIASPPEGPAS